MWLRVASTVSLESTEQALIKALDASEIPMPIEYLVPCDAGEVAAVVTIVKSIACRTGDRF